MRFFNVFVFFMLTLLMLEMYIYFYSYEGSDYIWTKITSIGKDDSLKSPVSFSAVTGEIWKPIKTRKYLKKTLNFLQIPKKNINKTKTCEHWVVMTSIFYPTKITDQILKQGEWCLVIVGDLKSPEKTNWFNQTLKSEKLFYLDTENQKQLNYKLFEHLPWNHFSRKNLGYLFAIENGAKWIYDTYEDNLFTNEDTFFKYLLK